MCVRFVVLNFVQSSVMDGNHKFRLSVHRKMKKARIITKARNAGIVSTITALASVITPLNYDAVDSIQLYQTLLNMTLIIIATLMDDNFS